MGVNAQRTIFCVFFENETRRKSAYLEPLIGLVVFMVPRL